MGSQGLLRQTSEQDKVFHSLQEQLHCHPRQESAGPGPHDGGRGGESAYLLSSPSQELLRTSELGAQNKLCALSVTYQPVSLGGPL